MFVWIPLFVRVHESMVGLVIGRLAEILDRQNEAIDATRFSRFTLHLLIFSSLVVGMVTGTGSGSCIPVGRHFQVTR